MRSLCPGLPPRAGRRDRTGHGGRTGLVYTCARSFLGFTWTRTMIVDEQTGLCLAWRAQSASGDYSLSDGAGDFLCTDFVTQDVALPLSLEGQTA